MLLGNSRRGYPTDKLFHSIDTILNLLLVLLQLAYVRSSSHSLILPLLLYLNHCQHDLKTFFTFPLLLLPHQKRHRARYLTHIYVCYLKCCILLLFMIIRNIIVLRHIFSKQLVLTPDGVIYSAFSIISWLSPFFELQFP